MLVKRTNNQLTGPWIFSWEYASHENCKYHMTDKIFYDRTILNWTNPRPVRH